MSEFCILLIEYLYLSFFSPCSILIVPLSVFVLSSHHLVMTEKEKSGDLRKLGKKELLTKLDELKKHLAGVSGLGCGWGGRRCQSSMSLPAAPCEPGDWPLCQPAEPDPRHPQEHRPCPHHLQPEEPTG